jgi:hypothetical protein
MGCLKKLGCLLLAVVLLAAGAAGAWYWLRGRSGGGMADSAGLTAAGWQALTPTGAQRARTALERLRAPRGPAYQSVAPGDLAAYIFQELSRTLPSSADSIEAAAVNNQLCVRAVVRTSEFGDRNALGAFAMLLGDRERLQLCGVLRIIRPGAGEFQVKQFRIREFNLPQAVIPRLIGQMSRGTRPAGISPDGLPLQTPEYVGDVRVQRGEITLYKRAP